jgi:Putative auto-transporter adhesin, head GIN domain
MLNGSTKQNIDQTKSIGNKKAWLFLFLAGGISLVVDAQTVTQTIITNQISYGGTNANPIKGNGIMAKEKRAVDPFHAIKIEGAMNVNYRRAASVQVEVIGDQNLLPIITTQVDQGILVVSAKQSYQTQQPITIELSSPHLTAATLQGAGELVLKDVSETSLHLELQGSGNVNVEGGVEQLSVHTKGSGDVNAKALESIHADLQVKGSGNIITTVKKSLTASVVGSGNITYFGHPKKVDPHLAGSGDIAAGD